MGKVFGLVDKPNEREGSGGLRIKYQSEDQGEGFLLETDSSLGEYW